MHGARDALAYGVKVTGCTLFVVDAGRRQRRDRGPGRRARRADDDEHSLHERIKGVERTLLVDTVGRMARDGWSIRGRRVTIP